MDFTGRPMKGYLLIDNEGTETDRATGTWIDKALAFNPLAKSSKRKNPEADETVTEDPVLRPGGCHRPVSHPGALYSGRPGPAEQQDR